MTSTAICTEVYTLYATETMPKIHLTLFFQLTAHIAFIPPKQCFPNFFLLTDPFWLQKITMDPHILAYVGTVSRC